MMGLNQYWRWIRSLYALEKGALLRPLGNVIYFMPPYVITPEQIYQLADIAHAGIDRATREL